MATFFALLRLLLLLLLLSDSAVKIASVGVGINYGQIANNLPSPSRVSVLLQSLNVSRVKLYDADPNVLLAFSNSNVDFIVGLGNEYLLNMTDPVKAQAWVQQHVQPHLPQTKISCILVGNEVFKSTDRQLYSYLLPAMQTVYNTLVNLGLDKQVMVTTAHPLNIMGNSYPPSAGTFSEEFAEYIHALLNFHAQVDSPFLINAYPYFAYKDDPSQVSLEYVLFQPNQGMTDPNTNLHYDNMLYAQIDAVYAAIKAMGHTDIEVRISETGWPSKGDNDEPGATLENAGICNASSESLTYGLAHIRIYNGNLLRRIQEKEGTPARPSVPINIYVFALFNENLKPGPTSERNYGLFYPNGTSVYDIGVQGYLPQFTYSSASKTNALSFCLLIFLIAKLIIA